MCASAQTPAFHDIRVEKRPGQLAGPALVTVNGKARRISAHALEAWPVMDGRNALVLALDSKRTANEKYRLVFVEGATRKRRDLGAVPFRSAELSQRELTAENWAFLLRGSDGEEPALV
ncbi:MAG TPA: hypothetical protein VK493_00090, partial [Bryobacteraceae bacterium]|nr:hypothetical protein [Bryobacteraceae bacterium]